MPTYVWVWALAPLGGQVSMRLESISLRQRKGGWANWRNPEHASPRGRNAQRRAATALVIVVPCAPWRISAGHSVVFPLAPVRPIRYSCPKAHAVVGMDASTHRPMDAATHALTYSRAPQHAERSTRNAERSTQHAERSTQHAARGTTLWARRPRAADGAQPAPRLRSRVILIAPAMGVEEHEQ